MLQYTQLQVAALALIAGLGLVRAGELDIPGLGYVNRAAPLAKAPWKRASGQQTYGLSQNYQGANFLDGFSFFNYPDPTNGLVNYVDSDDAWNLGLVYPTSSGSFIMQVDNTNWLAEGTNRNSVRITSNTPFKKGQILILDAAHMPYGCGTWPAFWTVGNNWPYGGEIDIVEGVNNNQKNQMTLHTAPGCSISPGNMAGTILQNSCDAFYNYNTGCGVQDWSTLSYGAGFNQAGGGVFATLWNDDGISIWFFSRNNIPADITHKNPAPSDWGKPRAFFSSDDCSMGQFFGDQTIVFDMSLCGDWGNAVYQSDGCPGTCSQQVMNPGSFNEAYWEVNVRSEIYGSPVTIADYNLILL